MTKRFGWAALLCGTALLSLTHNAAARGGRASYHLHTSAMVTAARYEARGTMLRVTNPENGKSVVVRVNDRGPFSPANRVLDLSTGAFSQLYGGLGRGHGPVTYEVIGGSELSSRGGSPHTTAKRSSKKLSKSRSSHKSYKRKKR